MPDQSNELPPTVATQPAPPTPAVPAAEITPEILKTAMKAFRRRLKLTQLDDASRIGRGPMSGGLGSSIAGITAPDQYPRAVWEELVKQGKLKHAGHGTYALVQ